MKRALAATLAMLATAAAWAQGGAATYSVRLLTPEAAGAVVGGIGVLGAPSGDACRRRSKSEPPRRPNIEPGVEADFQRVGCG